MNDSIQSLGGARRLGADADIHGGPHRRQGGRGEGESRKEGEGEGRGG